MTLDKFENLFNAIKQKAETQSPMIDVYIKNENDSPVEINDITVDEDGDIIIHFVL